MPSLDLELISILADLSRFPLSPFRQTFFICQWVIIKNVKEREVNIKNPSKTSINEQ